MPIESHSAPPDTVSVVIPAWNAAGTLVRALDSVAAQGRPPDEVILVDDGSTDDTAAVAARHPLGVRVVTQPNAGAAHARNQGAALARGTLLAFLDADDVWHPDKLAAQLAVFAAHPATALCATTFAYFPTDAPPPLDAPGSGAVRLVRDFRDLVRDYYLGTPTVMLRREAFATCGGFDPALRFGEDVDLWLRVGYGRVVARLDRQLVAVSRSAKSLTGSAGGEVEASDLRVLDRLAARHPEFMAAHGDAVRRARAVVHTRRGANLLTAGDAHQARRHFATALREAPGYGRAWYLWFRSWAPVMG